jgi:NADH:ubiquinone oxidoreductase subunit H
VNSDTSNMLWTTVWPDKMGLPGSSEGVMIAGALLLVLLLVLVIMPAQYFFSYLERKIAADFQARVGPGRDGLNGFFQNVFDDIKIFKKNQNIQEGFYINTLLLASFFVGFTSLATMPLGSLVVLLGGDVSVFQPFLSCVILGFLSLLLGLARSGSTRTLGGMRILSQGVAGLFPAMISMVSVLLVSGDGGWAEIVNRQAGSFLNWNMFYSPFLFLNFFVFILSGLVMFSLAPFDSSLMLQEAKGGLFEGAGKIEYLSLRLVRFFLLFNWLSLAAAAFCGGWIIPEGVRDFLVQVEWMSLVLFAEAVVVLIKVLVIFLGLLWISVSMPKLRVDQCTDFAWRILGPVALISFLGNGAWLLFFEGGLT